VSCGDPVLLGTGDFAALRRQFEAETITFDGDDDERLGLGMVSSYCHPDLPGCFESLDDRYRGTSGPSRSGP